MDTTAHMNANSSLKEESKRPNPVTAQEGTDPSVFCPVRWIRQLKALSASPRELDIETYVAMLYETTNLFKKMGSALSMAFSGNTFPLSLLDITTKAEILK